MGIATQEQVVSFATRTAGWIVPTAQALNIEVLKKILLAERGCPFLVSRNLADDVRMLGSLFQATPADRHRLAENIQHCMTALAYTTGQPMMQRGPTVLTIQDALDAAVVGPMMAVDVARYYTRVALPVVRHNAALDTGSIDESQLTRWVITYDHLMLRAMAHFTRDPTLLRWFQEGVSPIEQFGMVASLTPQQTTAYYLWMACGESEEVMSKYHAAWLPHLPESPKLIQAQYGDKHLPSLRLGLIQLLDQFATHPTATTLYGRKPTFGLRPPELLHYVLFGTVSDILDVVVASVAKDSTTHWLLSEQHTNYNHWVRANIVGWTAKPADQWQRTLDHIAALANPMVVELDPRVVVG